MSSTSSDRVDGLSASVSIKAPVKVATTTNITLSGEQTIDGVAVYAFQGFQVSSITEDDRVLVKNQTTQTQNGIYLVRTGAWARAKDFDGSRDVTQGTLVYVKSGTVNANSYWRLTTTSNPITFGTDNITFEFAGFIVGHNGAFRYKYSSTTTMADPGSTYFRLNSATLSSVTTIAISATAWEPGSPDISDAIAAWDTSTNTTAYGTITIKELGAPQNFAVYTLTSVVTDNSTYLQMTVSHVASSGSFSDGDPVIIEFTRAGDKGTTGAQGDFYDVALIAGYDAGMAAENIAVGTYAEWVMPRTGSFVGEAGYIDTAPTGAAAIVDIQKNGTTIYTTKPQFAATANTLTAGTLKTDGTEDFVSGDRITFKVTQIGSTIAGSGLRFTTKGTVTA